MGEGTRPTESSAAHSHIIKRPRLTKLLDDSGARLILLVAPAGYGKTTLAKQWLAEYQRPVAWYRCTTASADVAALATGLAAEIDAALNDGSTASSDRMSTLVAVQQRPDVLARALARSRDIWPKRLVIAIDDYHQLSSSDAAEEFVGELASLMLSTFVITTRTRPTWCTPRLSVYGEAVEVGTRELAMTDPEARKVFEASSREPFEASILEIARGWPVVIGLAARSGRTAAPSGALPHRLYEYLADDLIRGTTAETQRALTVLALTGTNERSLIRELVGAGAEVALSEADRRGLLTLESAARIVLHPLLGEFLIERLREEDRGSMAAIIDPFIDALVRNRRWDECLAVAEAIPEANRFAAIVLEDSLQDLLSNGRAATVRRWVTLARRTELADPVVELADAEITLRAGEYERAFAIATHASRRLLNRALRSRAELVAGRAAQLSDHRTGAKLWFASAEASAVAPQVRAAALWGQVIVDTEEETGELDNALDRFAAANDGTVEHAMRLAHGRMLVALARGDARHALDCAKEAAALEPLSTDPFASLAVLNQLTGALAYVALYSESLRAADHFIAATEESGIDFALNHALLAKARALVGLRRFAEARSLLRRVMTRAQAEPDPWVAAYAPVVEARLDISLGDLDKARDQLMIEPSSRATAGLHAESAAHRAVIEAASGNDAEALHWIGRSRRSTSIEAQSLWRLAATILGTDRSARPQSNELKGVDYVIESGYLDALVISCRAQPELAKRIVADGTHRGALMATLLASQDEPLARSAGLDIPRTIRRAETLSPRELEVYELMTQGRTNPEIARNLYISEATAKVHVRHILRKLGVRSRVEAVRAWSPESDSGFGDAG
jgi:ATP/maltotriose-dependent transcriptional regulator MalT